MKLLFIGSRVPCLSDKRDNIQVPNFLRHLSSYSKIYFIDPMESDAAARHFPALNIL